MQLVLTRNTLIKGVHFDAGSTVDVDERLGQSLLSLRRAVTAENPQTESGISDEGVTATAETATAPKRRKK